MTRCCFIYITMVLAHQSTIAIPSFLLHWLGWMRSCSHWSLVAFRTKKTAYCCVSDHSIDPLLLHLHFDDFLTPVCDCDFNYPSTPREIDVVMTTFVVVNIPNLGPSYCRVSDVSRMLLHPIWDCDSNFLPHWRGLMLSWWLWSPSTFRIWNRHIVVSPITLLARRFFINIRIILAHLSDIDIPISSYTMSGTKVII